jgi:hypothetical protein
MPRDTSKITKPSSSKKKEEAARLKRRKDESSDSDFVSDDEDYDEEEMDMQEYRELLAKKYPSKHINKKVNAGKRLQKTLDSEEESDEEEIKKKNTKKSRKNKKTIIEDDDESELARSDRDKSEGLISMPSFLNSSVKLLSCFLASSSKFKGFFPSATSF